MTEVAVSARCGSAGGWEDDGVSAADPAMPDMPNDADRSRGRYLHRRVDGGAAGVDEQWVAGEVGPGAWRVRSTRIAAAPVSRLEVDARWSAEVFAVVLRWVGSGSGVVRSATVACVEVPGAVEVRRFVDDVELEPVSVGGPLVLPALVLGGRLAAGPAYSFEVGDALDASTFLVPVPVEVSVQDAGDEVVMVGGSDVDGTLRRWRISGDGLDRSGEDVVGPGGLLLRRTTGDVVATLTEVSGPTAHPVSWGA